MPEQDDVLFEFPPELDAEEEFSPPSRLRRSVQVVVGLIVIIGLVYFSGVYQAFLYRRTPSGVEERRMGSVLDAETITVPVRAFVLVNGESFGSGRTDEEVQRIVENASRIWSQADITLRLTGIHRVNMSDADIGLFLREPRYAVSSFGAYSPDEINIFFVKTLKGIQGVNGVAFIGVHSVVVADLTTVFDFRVLAHEVGHIFGLGHVESDASRLMYTGADGTELTVEEVLTARDGAMGL